MIFRGALTLLRIRILRLPGVEGAEETVVASHPGSVMLSFRTHPFCLPLAELEGKMPLAADEV